MEFFYTKLFERLCGDFMTVRRVLGIGGKRRVLARFGERINSPKHANEFYLVDGDVDDLIGIRIASHPRLFRLSRYDIESFLIDPNAIAVVAQEEAPQQSVQYYRKAIEFEGWIEATVGRVCRLLAFDALCRSLPDVYTIESWNIARFVRHGSVVPDELSIRQFVEAQMARLGGFTGEERDAVLCEIMGRMGSSRCDILRWVSGKAILLPLLTRVIKRESGRAINVESLRFRLVGVCSLDALSDLRECIRELHGSIEASLEEKCDSP